MKPARIMAMAVLLAACLATGAWGQEAAAKQHYARGVDLAAQGQFPQAQAAFQEAWKLDPTLEPVRQCLEAVEEVLAGKAKAEAARLLFQALAHANAGQDDKALAALNQSLQVDPNYAQAYHDRGNVFRGMGDMDRACRDYHRSAELNPKLASSLLNRGNCHLEKGEFDQALADFNRALQINPNYTMVLNSRAVAYEKKGDFDQALADYRRALEINPRYGTAWFNLADALDKLGRHQEALEAYKKFLQHAQPDQQRYVERARQRIRALEK